LLSKKEDALRWWLSFIGQIVC